MIILYIIAGVAILRALAYVAVYAMYLLDTRR